MTREINEAAARNCAAYLWITPGKLFFGIKDQNGAEVLLDAPFSDIRDLQTAYYGNDFFGYPFREISLFMDEGTGYEAVPKALFSEGESAGLWLPGLPDRAPSFWDEEPGLPFGILFSAGEEVTDFMARSFARPHYFHPATGMIQTGRILSSRKGAGILLAHITKTPRISYLDVSVSREGNLLFANRFELHGETDILYFITSVWRVQGLSQDKDLLRVFGDDLDDGTLSALEGFKKSVGSFLVNDYSEIGTEAEGLTAFPSALRLRLLCA